MLYSLKQIRDANGGLGNLTDEQIVKSTYGDFQKYYGTEDEYAKAIGYGGAGRGLTMSRLSAGVDSYQGQLYGAAESLARSAGMDGVADAAGRGRKANKDAADYASAQAKTLGGIDDWRDVRGPIQGLNFAGGLAAQSLPQMAAQATGGFLGGLVGGVPGAIAGGAAVGYGNAFADITDNQGEQTENQPGGRRTDPMSAALYAAPYAAVDTFTGVGGKITRGLSRVAGAVEKPIAKESINFLERGLNDITGVKGGLARAGYSGVKAGVVEGAGEAFQETMNQGGRMAVDPNASFTSEEAQKRYLDSAVGGGVLGSLLGGAGNRGRRYGIQPAAAPAPSSDVLAANPAGPNQVFGSGGVGTQDIINQNTGVGLQPYAGKDYAKQFEAAASAPTGQRNIGIDGLETDETALDSAQRQSGVLLEERQRANDDRQRAQAIKDNADALTATRNSRDERAGQFGVDNTKKNLNNLFGELEDAHKQGVLDDVGVAQGLSLLQTGDVKSFTALLKTATEDQARLNDTSVEGTINRTTGVDNRPVAGKKYGSQFEAAASALTGKRTNNADGIEVNETALESVQRNSGLLEQKRKEDAAAKATTDAAEKEKADLSAAAATAGVNPRSKKAMDLFSQLRDAHREGLITPATLNENTEQLNASKFAAVDRFLKGATAASAAVQTADAQTAQTNLAALQPKAPDATPATAATPQSAAQTDAAPKAPANPVATAAPASGDNVPAAQPKPAAAAAVEKATPAKRAAALLDKLKVPHDKPVKVTRRVNGKDATVGLSALDNWTQLLTNPQVGGRALKALGIDADGNQVASPMSFAEIGKQENPPVSREAVRKQLARHGINETTVNAAVSAPGALDARSGTALAEAADATGIVTVPKESDITATDGEILPQAPSSGKGTFGVREEDSLSKAAGSGLVQGGRETSAQKMSRVQGDTLIKTGQDAQEKVDAPTAEDIRQAAENQRRADARNAAILNHPSADEARVDWDESKQADSPSYAELKPQVRAAFVTEHAEQVADTGNRWAPIQNLITRFEKELDDGDYTKVSRDAPVQNRTARVDGSTAGATPGRTDRAGGDTAAVQPETGGQISGDAAGARSAEPAAQPTVVVKKRRTVERSDAPDRPTALIELRKRESILRSLIKCMGG